ncbi:hypothetical protein [Methylophaga sp.]|uniref:hypothetical protein n=1 Tax=Methylophaga sp. TaxID=2024840 RepID=UPI003A928ABD
MEIQILNHEQDKMLGCFYGDYEFELERDPDDDFSFGNWYMIVKDESGAYLCDGWIDDSSHLTTMGAFEAACSACNLEMPSNWPPELSSHN